MLFRRAGDPVGFLFTVGSERRVLTCVVYPAVVRVAGQLAVSNMPNVRELSPCILVPELPSQSFHR